jgi:uncharacterized membrane protein YfcA
LGFSEAAPWTRTSFVFHYALKESETVERFWALAVSTPGVLVGTLAVARILSRNAEPVLSWIVCLIIRLLGTSLLLPPGS